MSKRIVSLFCILVATVLATPIFESTHVHVKNNFVYLDRNGIPQLQENFTEGLARWKVTNFENLLSITTKTYEGENCCYLTLDRENCDNAWEMLSAPIDVQPGADFTISIRGRGSINMEYPRGYGELYNTAIFWLDASGQKLANSFPYKFKTKPDIWTDTQFDGIVPEGAVKAIVSLGGDGPNFNQGDFLAISMVSFFMRTPDMECVPQGSFVSVPVLTDGNPFQFAWNGDNLASGSIRFQISCAPDANGIPGEWTAFVGPDGMGNTYFTAKSERIAPSHPWIRYKAFFTSNGKRSPILNGVTIGDVTHSSWTIGDDRAPQVVLITESPNPHPELPFIFRVDDDSPIDWTTFKCFFDQVDVTAKLKRNGNVFSHQEDKPFSPLGISMYPLRWNIGNYEQRLKFTRLEERPSAVRVELLGDKELDTAFEFKSMPLPVIPGKEYSFAIRVRHNMNLQGMEKSRNTITWNDKDLAVIDQPAAVIELGPATTDWVEYRYKLTAPANAAAAQVTIGFDVPDIKTDEYFDLDSLAFDGPAPEITGFSCAMPNIHTFEVSGKDIWGNSFSSENVVFYGELVTHDVATMRDDGFVLIDGKPFFPIGLYGMSEKAFNDNSYDVAFKELRKNGFNFAHTYKDCGDTPQRKKFLDTAAANGIKVWIPPVGDIVDCMLKERNHPAILAWYLGDDTADHVSAEAVRNSHLKCHAIDNAHLTTQADYVGAKYSSRYMPYVHSTDTFLPEIYPVCSETPAPSEVPTVIRDMDAVRYSIESEGSPVKSIWVIIQHFQGYGNWKRFPSFAELRAMSYLAIIHGAHGITWYTYGGDDNANLGVTSSPERWNEICTVSRELSFLSNAITSRSAKAQPKATVLEGPQNDALGYPSISCLLKDNDGNKVLMTANSATEAIKASIPLNGFKTAAVLFESRTVTIDADGRLNDDFEPFAVHVYQLNE